MSETKHTPGRWDTDRQVPYIPSRPDFYKRIYSTDPGPDRDYTIAFVRDADTAVRKANSQLIAAAPELYEALKNLLEDCDTDEGRISVLNARAALAKAEGK